MMDSLEAMAETARSSKSRIVSACLGAERGEAYVAVFDLSEVRARVLAPVRIAPSDAIGPLSGAVIRLPSDREIEPSPALAAARAVFRSPGDTTSVPRATYVRPSAAEEFHGVSRA
jgi:tRNA A37 threonylcarbamoyladenosine modification protein TsaB